MCSSSCCNWKASQNWQNGTRRRRCRCWRLENTVLHTNNRNIGNKSQNICDNNQDVIIKRSLVNKPNSVTNIGDIWKVAHIFHDTFGLIMECKDRLHYQCHALHITLTHNWTLPNNATRQNMIPILCIFFYIFASKQGPYESFYFCLTKTYSAGRTIPQLGWPSLFRHLIWVMNSSTTNRRIKTRNTPECF